MEKESSPEVGHTPGGINERIKLWESLIKESELDEIYRERLCDVIGEAKGIKFDDEHSRDDWVYFTIHQIADIINEAIKNGADESVTRALFENLRDDVWSFWRGMKD